MADFILAQSLRHNIALPYIGLSAYSSRQKDPFSFTANQAALAKIDQPDIGLYGEKRFLLAATDYYSIATAVPTKMGNFGLQVNYSGFKNFNENEIGLAYARSLGKKVDVGVQFNYYGYRIPSYNNASTIIAEVGAIIHFTDKLNGGIHIFNPAGGKLSNSEDEKLAAAYTFGLGYDASDHVFISGEIIKEEDMPVNVVAGVQYQFAQQFFTRIGFTSATSSIFTAVGAGWNKIRVDISVSYHPQLGFSPGILLISQFGKKNNTVQ